MAKILIGLHGKKYAGKDTAALGLIGHRGYEKVNFAGPLKRMVEVYLASTKKVEETVVDMLDKFFEEQGLSGYTRQQLLSGDGQFVSTTYLNGHTPAYAIGELIAWGVTHIGGDFWHGQDTGPGVTPDKLPCYIEGALKEAPLSILNGKSPRDVMQTLGTEWGRQRLGQNIWTDVGIRRTSTIRLAVVTDVRFDNEAQAVIDAGGIVVEIIREGQAPTGHGDSHASEKGIDPALISTRVYNNGSVSDVQQRLIRVADEFALRPVL